MRKVLSYNHDVMSKLAILDGKLNLAITRGYPVDQHLLLRVVKEMTKLMKMQQQYLKENIKQIHSPLMLTDRGDALEALKPKVKEELGIELEVEMSISANCAVYSDPELARHVTHNMLTNAAKAGATKVAMTYEEHDVTVDVIFRDNGRGMTAGQIDKLGFGYTTTGSGEGLRSVRILIAEAGGDLLRPTSIVGVGTEFTVVLQKVIKPTEDAA